MWCLKVRVMNKMLWYNDADIWHNFSDWVVAELSEECNKILSEKEGERFSLFGFFQTAVGTVLIIK